MNFGLIAIFNPLVDYVVIILSTLKELKLFIIFRGNTQKKIKVVK
jgi:hypothetical protein